MPDPDKLLLDVEELEAVGFVDAGANPDSDIMIWKRKKENAVDNADTRNMLQKIYDAVTKNADQTDGSGDSIPDTGEETMELNKSELSDEVREHIEALEAQVAELQATPEPEGDEGEPDVMKSLPDEQRSEIEKRMAEQEARIAKAEKEAADARAEAAIEKRERRMASFRKQASEKMPLLKGTTDEVAEVLFEAEENLPEDINTRLVETLTAASAQLAESGLIAEIGKHGGDQGPDSPYSELGEIAKSIREADPEITFEQAMTKAMQDPANRALVEAYRRQRQ